MVVISYKVNMTVINAAHGFLTIFLVLTISKLSSVKQIVFCPKVKKTVYSSCYHSLFYYSFRDKIFHHNQLLLIKFGKNQWFQKFWHIEPMTSKWRWKCSLLQVIELLTKKTWRWGCIFGEQKKQEQNGKTPLRMGKYFEWKIKQS